MFKTCNPYTYKQSETNKDKKVVKKKRKIYKIKVPSFFVYHPYEASC